MTLGFWRVELVGGPHDGAVHSFKLGALPARIEIAVPPRGVSRYFAPDEDVSSILFPSIQIDVYVAASPGKNDETLLYSYEERRVK